MITVEHIASRFASSKNPILLRVTSNNVAEPNFRFIGQLIIYRPTGNIFVNLMEFPDGSGKAELDVSSLLDAYLSEQAIPLPQLTNFTWLNISTAVSVRYSYELKEGYGVPLVVDSLPTVFPTGGNPLYALRGGVAYPHLPFQKYLSEYLTANNPFVPFLTWKPRISLVAIDQPEFLAFSPVNTTPDNDVALFPTFEVFYDDGTSTVNTNISTTAPLGSVHVFPVGIKQAGLDQINPAKKIVRYTAYVRAGVNRISEIREYIVDHQTHQATRYLVFFNNLAGWDTVRFIGTGEFQADYKRSSAELAQGVYSSYGTRKQIQSEEIAGRKLHTGYISRAEVNWLRNLFLSDEVYAVENGKLIPVEVTSKKFAMPEEADMNSLTIEYDYRFRNQVYSPGNLPLV